MDLCNCQTSFCGWLYFLGGVVFSAICWRIKEEFCRYGLSNIIVLDEIKLGIVETSVSFKCDRRVEQIAYKIRMEIITRKVGLQFDEENDVIVEVYNSWYAAFGIIRELLEEIPSGRIRDAKGLIDVTVKVLNIGLRNHLTKWQAKFRRWYKVESKKYPEMSPQDIQRKYPDYSVLVDDLKRSNTILIKYAGELEKICYRES